MKYNYDLNVFKRETEISYYLLGVFMTDGSVVNRTASPTSKRVSLTTKDYDWICEIRDLICPEMKVIKDRNSFVFNIHSTELGNWLINKGCIPKKSLTMKFPKVPIKYLPDFIRGCIDGDGSVKIYPYIKEWKNKKHQCINCSCYFCGASIDFINHFKMILDQQNIYYSFVERKPKQSMLKDGRKILPTSNMYYIKIKSASMKIFLEWIYYTNNPLSMKRKIDVAKKIINYYK